MSCEVWNKEHQLVLNRSRHQVKKRHQEGNNRNWSTFVVFQPLIFDPIRRLRRCCLRVLKLSPLEFLNFCTPVSPDVTQNCTSRFLSEHAWYLKWWGDFHSFLPNHSHLSFCSCQLISSFLPSIHPRLPDLSFFSSTLDVSLTDLLPLGDTSSCDLLPVALITKSASPKNTWSASRQINPLSEQINSSNLLFAINITLLLTRLPEAFHLKRSQIVYRRTS